MINSDTYVYGIRDTRTGKLMNFTKGKFCEMKCYAERWLKQMNRGKDNPCYELVAFELREVAE